MNELNKEEKAIEIVVKIVLIGIVALGILFAVGCEPENYLCEDCYQLTVSGGSTFTQCTYYECE